MAYLFYDCTFPEWVNGYSTGNRIRFCFWFFSSRFFYRQLDKVYNGLHETNKKYPFLTYGYDWLAFAHFVLAILFIGPYKNPVRNKWVIEFGMIACVLIIPFALLAGHYRGIPFMWRLIDCSFGIIGLIPLSICLTKINQLEKTTTTNI
jgi:hypothetical protein